MEFLPAQCPTCSGKLQLPNDQKIVKCMYCGSDIIVKQAVKSYGGVNTENLLKLARVASNAGNYFEAYNYYTKVLEYENDNFEGWFGKAKSAGWMSTLRDFRIPEMISGFENAIEFTEKEKKINVKKAANHEINDICNAYYSLAKSHLLDFIALDNSWNEYLNQCSLLISAFEVAHRYDTGDKTTIQNIIFICSDNIQGVKYRDPYDNNISKVVFLSDEYENKLRETMKKYSLRMVRLDPSYKMPEVSRQKPDGCFIATATMGDIDHPIVQSLRIFRDECLLNNFFGTFFVKKYYKYSPPFADYIRDRSVLKKISFYFLIKPASIIVKIHKKFK